jgi:hypothetical protein
MKERETAQAAAQLDANGFLHLVIPDDQEPRTVTARLITSILAYVRVQVVTAFAMECR